MSTTTIDRDSTACSPGPKIGYSIATMLQNLLAFSVLFVFLGIPWIAAADPKPVDERLAEMIEEVAIEVNLSFNISSSTRTSVTIDSISGRSVCSDEARIDVERLQKGFDAHPNIYRNLGPALALITLPDKKKRSAQPSELKALGLLSGYTSIYVSIR